MRGGWVVVVLALLAFACGSDDDGGSPATGGGTGSGATGGSSGGAGGSSGSAAGSGGGSTGGSSGAAPVPDAQFVPQPTGACPELVDGTITVAPAGIAPRDVRVWISPEATSLDGPLIFYWHGTGSAPMEALFGIGNDQLQGVLKEGGIVAAPFHDPAAGTWPWYLTVGSGKEDDLLVADEILACAIEKVGVDVRRIHSMGMSAGGLQTVQMSYRRSGYIASVAPYSGGLIGTPPNQNPNNAFAAMVFHGGASDVVGPAMFQQLSENYQSNISGAGHFAFLCDHGNGHTIPTDARTSVQAFLSAHPYGQTPSPYTGGLPPDFPSYCSLP